jgi:hypothetical protein
MIGLPFSVGFFGNKKAAGTVACGSDSILKVISEPQAHYR